MFQHEDKSMQHLIIDAQITGASGDMFLAALLDLFDAAEKNLKIADKKKEELIQAFANKIPEAAGLKNEATIDIKINRKNVNAFEGLNLQITIREPHRHLHIPQAKEIITKAFELLDFSPKAQDFSNKAITILFEAEAKAHGETIDKVHLHEAGSLDTFLDILGTAYLLDKMNLFDASITILPIATGFGTVTFSHGTLPIPPPAVAEIIKSYKLPVYPGSVNSELLTPTGAIILASLQLVCDTVVANKSPMIVIDRYGIGLGTKVFDKMPNGLRLMLGQKEDEEYPQEEISIIETNLDDCSGETIGFLSQRLLDMGAKDVYLTPIYMKKGRPGTKISVLCKPDEVQKYSAEILNQTSTIGVRISNSSKIMLRRELQTFEVTINNKVWKVRGKIAYDKNGSIAHFKPEFDDVKEITEETDLTLNDVVGMIREKMRKDLKL
ncbi:MAG: nickel pincer cofactor biosynthesis protein LarC [Asgard group archaeon]|nr:nickel pincer cofactor biosynthesis protein LarC [Asgard group archaeon]